MILVKIHTSGDSAILCLCDKDLIGKTIGHIKISKNFYEGEEKPEQELLDLIQESNNINAIGQESIDFLLKHKIINKEDIIFIEKIPHIQIL